MALNIEKEKRGSELVTESIAQTELKSIDKDDLKLNETSISESKLSKRQLKKLKKTEKWLATKQQKRADERKRKKEKRKLAREQGIILGPTRKSLKYNTMAGSSCKIRVVVDCSYDDLMNDKDIGNVVKQLNHCYAANRRSENPLQFYTTSVEKQLKKRLDSQDDTKHWDIHLENISFEKLFSKADIVYLSSDSANIVETLEEDKVYIIGGLVDHNHHKGLCHRLAEEKGLYHAKLPISDYVQFNSRKVLTINQVFEILLGYTETKDWEKAFLKALPKRKGAVTKSPAASQDETTTEKDKDSVTDKEVNESDCEDCNDSPKNDSDNLDSAESCNSSKETDIISEQKLLGSDDIENSIS